LPTVPFVHQKETTSPDISVMSQAEVSASARTVTSSCREASNELPRITWSLAPAGPLADMMVMCQRSPGSFGPTFKTWPVPSAAMVARAASSRRYSVSTIDDYRVFDSHRQRRISGASTERPQIFLRVSLVNLILCQRPTMHCASRVRFITNVDGSGVEVLNLHAAPRT